MVKKITEPQADTATDHSESVQTEASKALLEIDMAADLATQALSLDSIAQVPLTKVTAQVSEQIAAGGTLGSDGVVKPQEQFVLTADQQEQRVQAFIKRANAQKVKGRALLTKDYVGALSVEMQVKINDVNIGASAERFIGMCDLFLYTLGKQGPSVLGGDETEKCRDMFVSLVDNYEQEASDGAAQAQTALVYESSESMDGWITPSHKTAAFAMTINAKHRQTARILRAMEMWDKLVLTQSVLEWNGKLDSSMVAQTRQLERRMISKIHAYAAKSLVGLKRRTERAVNRPNLQNYAAPAQEFAAA